jgi:hypothetical protein
MISTLEEAVGPKPEDRPMTVSKLIEGVWLTEAGIMMF